MFISSLCCHNQRTKSSKTRRQFRKAALRVFVTKVFQALKERPEEHGKKLSNETIFNVFMYIFSNSYHLNSMTNLTLILLNTTLLLHLINRDRLNEYLQ